MDLLVVLKALADESRLRLMAILLRGEFTVQELTAILAGGQSRISHHLKILADCGLVAVKRQGTWGYYRAVADHRCLVALRPLLEDDHAGRDAHQVDLGRLARVLEERRRRSRMFFDQHARQWDELAGRILPVPGYHAELLAQVPRGGTVVEVGSGTGGLLAELSRRAAALIAIDHSPAMLDLARQRLTAEGLGNVELRLGEMSHLPLADGVAATVLLNMVLHHAADPPAVLREMRRVLGRPGTLLLADLARHERERARDELADQWLGFDEEEITGWLQQAGFAVVVCRRLAGAAAEVPVLLVQAQTE